MLKKSLIIICSLQFCFAAKMYSSPSEEANVLSDVDPNHEYVIRTQDWVEVKDKTSGEKGWAKLSELKSALSANSQWSYSWHSTNNINHQSMHYKPLSNRDVADHVKKAHKRHKRIMSEFQSFWQEIDALNESFAQDVSMAFDEESTVVDAEHHA